MTSNHLSTLVQDFAMFDMEDQEVAFDFPVLEWCFDEQPSSMDMEIEDEEVHSVSQKTLPEVSSLNDFLIYAENNDSSSTTSSSTSSTSSSPRPAKGMVRSLAIDFSSLQGL